MQSIQFEQASDALACEIKPHNNKFEAKKYLTSSRIAALQQLKQLDVKAYGKTRNYLQGAVTGLSAAIENGILSETEILSYLRSTLANDWPQAYRFVQQLSWRQFFQQKWQLNHDAPRQAQQAYKTGWQDGDYQMQIPQQVLQAQTPSALINQLIVELQTTGYLHNHGRLYLASFVVHWLGVHWRTGADWMLQELADGNLASNHFSWQWVASTSSPKPYIFNLENAQKFCGESYDTCAQNNAVLDDSYENLHQRLFPNMALPARS